MDELNRVANEINWLVSLLVAIPLSIIANLLTPRFQNWLGRRSKKNALTRITQIETEVAEIAALAADPNKVQRRTLYSIVTILTWFSVGSLPIFYQAGVFLTPLGFGFEIAYAIGGGIGSVFYLMAILHGQRTLSLLRRVDNFASFEQEAKVELDRLKQTAGA